jgi:predicted RNA-binding Zn-ribbon protein involved in translation (DUF1610 family)
MKCLKCNVEVEAMLYQKNKKRYVAFVCPKCKNAVLTDIVGDLIEDEVKE